MAYKRRRTTYRRRTTFKRTARPPARRFARSVRRVVNTIAEEKYYAINGLLNANSAVTWQFASALQGLVQGTTQTTRLGNRIYVKRLELSVTLGANVGMGLNGSICRFVVYHNRNTGGTGSALSGLLITYDQLFDTNTFDALRAINQKGRATILKDGVYPMMATSSNAGTTVVTTSGPVNFRVRIPINKTIVYNGNAGTIADLITDDYGVGFCSDDAACCQIYIRSKVIFTDM